MPNNRREFLRISAVLASGLVLPFYSCDSGNRQQENANANADTTAANTTSPKEVVDQFGIQLWSVKEDMNKDPQGTLRQLASYGYKQIEGFEGEKGLFWGMSNTEFKNLIDGLGMTLVASHAGVKEDFETKAAKAGEIGMKYLIDPYEGAQETLDDYKRMAERFNQLGEICKKNGLRFAYHNHDYTFQEVNGVIPQTILMEQTDPELVDFEMDIYWVVTAGADPQKFLKEYPGRYRLGHVKDRMKDVPATEAHASTVLGTGAIDYATILRTAKDNGMEYFIVEQERFEGTTPLESSERNAAFMRDIRI